MRRRSDMAVLGFIVGLAVGLLIGVVGDGFAAPDKCGAWRWSVKTLSDPAAIQVSLATSKTTVAKLRALKAPAALARDTPRIAPVEFTLWGVRARLLYAKQEADRDFHVVIADPVDSRATMIAEFPDPACAGAKDSPRVTLIAQAREAFVKAYGQPSAQQFLPLGGRVVGLVGVAFFDEIHGQRGVAPNGIELHPVLKVVP